MAEVGHAKGQPWERYYCDEHIPASYRPSGDGKEER